MSTIQERIDVLQKHGISRDTIAAIFGVTPAEVAAVDADPESPISVGNGSGLPDGGDVGELLLNTAPGEGAWGTLTDAGAASAVDLTDLADAVDDMGTALAYPALVTLDELIVLNSEYFVFPDASWAVNPASCYRIGNELVVQGKVLHVGGVDFARAAGQGITIGTFVASARPVAVVESPVQGWNFNYDAPTPAIIQVGGPEAGHGAVYFVPLLSGNIYEFTVNVRLLLPAPE